jgi:hypothetical protein
VFPDGKERPIAFASRSLNQAEKNYAQINKEALALIWGVKKFHHYIYGRKFMLITDHQPLKSILCPSKGVSATTAARLQRYALILAAYDYDIKYRKSADHANADGLSHLPLEQLADVAALDCVDVFHINQIDILPVIHEEIRKVTR